MSVPRPAMFVAIVTAPGSPASPIINDSRSCCFAFNTSCATPPRRNMSDSRSDASTDAVPTKTGCRFSLRS